MQVYGKSGACFVPGRPIGLAYKNFPLDKPAGISINRGMKNLLAALFALTLGDSSAFAETPSPEFVESRKILAERGDADAQYDLGLMYDKGRGVAEDAVLAYMWLNLAVSKGDKNA